MYRDPDSTSSTTSFAQPRNSCNEVPGIVLNGIDAKPFASGDCSRELKHVSDPYYVFGDLHIRVAQEPDRLREVGELVNRLYSWRGYQTSCPKVGTPHKKQFTLEATVGEYLFGTLTVTLDSADRLAADGLYPDEMNALRKDGVRLCEFTKLAIEPHFNPYELKSKEFLARLIHVAFVHARLISGATDMVIEVNPRHAGYYRRMLGFTQAGPERLCERVQAPAVLMHIDMAYMQKQIARHGGNNRGNDTRTLYPHFLSPLEQYDLWERMARDDASVPSVTAH